MTYHVAGAGGIDIACETAGEGRPVLLIHGFGASRGITWRNTGWYDVLAKAGFRVIAIDCRGHGESEKPHRPQDYEEGLMAEDCAAVLREFAATPADIMGYSMGAQIAIRLMHDSPDLVRRCILAGAGETYFHRAAAINEAIAEGLEAPDPAAVTLPIAREFRTFCERAGNDMAAMAACMRRPRRIFTSEELSRFPQPILVVCGAEDVISGPPEPLAHAFQHGKPVVVPRRNHHSTVGDRVYKDTVVNFLNESD
ncbi:MAG TPA: alpha/beta hydrolase [Micropepsaceae bacterium]|nr:alpha/beta hydrolase [Micropepsaceae bacterium]